MASIRASALLLLVVVAEIGCDNSVRAPGATQRSFDQRKAVTHDLVYVCFRIRSRNVATRRTDGRVTSMPCRTIRCNWLTQRGVRFATTVSAYCCRFGSALAAAIYSTTNVEYLLTCTGMTSGAPRMMVFVVVIFARHQGGPSGVCDGVVMHDVCRAVMFCCRCPGRPLRVIFLSFSLSLWFP